MTKSSPQSGTLQAGQPANGQQPAIRVVLTRDSILAAPDLQFAYVASPEWGGDVRIRGLTGRERDFYEARTVQIRGQDNWKVDLRNARALLVAMGACDESGAPLFTQQDVNALGEKNAAVLERISDEIRKLSGMQSKDEEDADMEKASELSLDDAKKN